MLRCRRFLSPFNISQRRSFSIIDQLQLQVSTNDFKDCLKRNVPLNKTKTYITAFGSALAGFRQFQRPTSTGP